MREFFRSVTTALLLSAFLGSSGLVRAQVEAPLPTATNDESPAALTVEQTPTFEHLTPTLTST